MTKSKTSTHRILILKLTVFVMLLGCTFPNPLSEIIVLEGATLIVGDGSNPIENAVVIIEKDKIIDVGIQGVKPYPKNAKIVNLKGKWIVPGFMDLHIHINDADYRDEVLRTLLQFGVTTIRNPAASIELGVELRDQIVSGKVFGPRMFTSGKLIDIKGGFWAGSSSAAEVGTPEEMRAEVIKQANQGVDYVKLYAHLSPDMIQAGIDQAHELGIKVIGHLGKTGWGEAASMGIDAVTHSGTAAPTWELLPKESQVPFLEFFAPHQKPEFNATLFGPWRKLVDLNGPEMAHLISELVTNRVEVNPTLVIVEVMFWGDDMKLQDSYEIDYAPDSLASQWKDKPHPYTSTWTNESLSEAKKVFQINLGIVRRLHEAGALITTGTDFPLPWVTPGIGMHREMELLNKSGIAQIDVLTIATRNGAEALGILDKVGTIETGKIADLVILDADPLVDIRNTRSIYNVYHEGKIVSQSDKSK